MPNFYARHVLEVIYRNIEAWPVVILEGPRTVGKSTLLQQIAKRWDVGIVDLDEPDIRHRVESDPQAYLAGKRPVLIDEYPKIPGLLSYIKARLNRDGSPGQFVLTGSASVEASDSDLSALVGTYSQVPILPLTQAEILGSDYNFLEEAFRDFEGLGSSGPSNTTRESYIARVLTGGFPLMLRSLDDADRYQRFTDQVDQTINYGMSNLYEVRGHEHLQRLLGKYAAKAGQTLNMQGAAREVGLKRSTAENYTRLLEFLFMIYRLPSWKTNDLGPVRRPKLYMVDSGVGGRLLCLTEDRILGGEPLFLKQYGHLLETLVLGEVRNMLSWMDGPNHIGYWKDRQGNEVDLVVERPDQNAVIGIEVKASSKVRSGAWKGLRKLGDQLGDRFRGGILMYGGDTTYRLDDDLFAVPIDRLWGGQALANVHRQQEPRRPPSGGISTPAKSRTGVMLTAESDPLSTPLRAAVAELIDRISFGEASYWEVAIVASEHVHFGDFYSIEGVTGRLHWFDAWSGGETDPIDQCAALMHRQGPSATGGEIAGFGAVIHPAGSMALIIPAGHNPPYGYNEWHLMTEWARDIVRFAHEVLLPHSTAWTYWSAGRRLRSGRTRFTGVVRGGPGTPDPALAMVDNPPHKGIPLDGDLDRETSQLVASFYEWFGVPARTLPSMA